MRSGSGLYPRSLMLPCVSLIALLLQSCAFTIRSKAPTSTTILKEWSSWFSAHSLGGGSGLSRQSALSSIASNSLGEVVLVWTEQDAGTGTSFLFLQERKANGTWLKPLTIRDALDGGANFTGQPKASISESGHAIVTWSNTQGLKYIDRTPGGAWSEPQSTPVVLSDNIAVFGAHVNSAGQVLLSIYDRGYFCLAEGLIGSAYSFHSDLSECISFSAGVSPSSLASAQNESGAAIVAWSESDGVTIRVYVAERSNAGVWTVPADNTQYFSLITLASEPAVDLNDAGEAIVAWREGLPMRLYAATRSSGGVWTKPAFGDALSPVSANNAQIPLAGIDPDGNAYVSYRQGDELFLATKAAAGAWIVPADESAPLSFGTGSLGSFRLVNSASGAAALSWRETGSTAATELFISTRASNGTWTHPASNADYFRPVGETSEFYSFSTAMDSLGAIAVQYATADGVSFLERSAAGAWTIPNASEATALSYHRMGGVTSKINSSGEAVVVWNETSDDTTMSIFAATRSSSGVWSFPSNTADAIATGLPTKFLATESVVALNETGSQLVAWVQGDSNGDPQVFKAERTRNSAWTKPTDDTDFISVPGFAAASIASSLNNLNEAVLTWVQSDGSTDRILTATRSSAGVWSTPTDFTGALSLAGETTASPQVTLDDQSRATVIWVLTDQGTGQNFLQMAERSSSGVWIKPALASTLVSPVSDNVRSWSLKGSRSGHVILGWSQDTGNRDVLFAAIRDTDGAWTIPTNASERLSPTHASDFEVDISQAAVAEDGSMIYIWPQADDADVAQIYGAMRSSSGVWTVPVSASDSLSQSTEQSFTRFSVSIGNNSRAAVVWDEPGSLGGRNAVLRAHTLNSGWSSKIQLGGYDLTADKLGTSSLQIDVSKNGLFLISWLTLDLGTILRTYGL
jgi:uncharacterized protein YheU (UPF0270 family)